MDEKLRSDIWHFFHEATENAEERCLYTDSFSVVCWMYISGKQIAANKLLNTLLHQVEKQHNKNCQPLINNIKRELHKGNGYELGLRVSSRMEIQHLFDDIESPGTK